MAGNKVVHLDEIRGAPSPGGSRKAGKPPRRCGRRPGREDAHEVELEVLPGGNAWDRLEGRAKRFFSLQKERLDGIVHMLARGYRDGSYVDAFGRPIPEAREMRGRSSIACLFSMYVIDALEAGYGRVMEKRDMKLARHLELLLKDADAMLDNGFYSLDIAQGSSPRFLIFKQKLDPFLERAKLHNHKSSIASLVDEGSRFDRELNQRVFQALDEYKLEL